MTTIPEHIFEEILKNIYDSNNNIKFRLRTRESYAEDILISYSNGGARGGNCYGDRAHNYDAEESDIISDIKEGFYFLTILDNYIKNNTNKTKYLAYQSETGNKINTLLDKTIDELNGSSFDEYSSDDYYGNYTEYKITSVKILPFMKEVLSEKDFDNFKVVYDKLVAVENHQAEIGKNQEDYKAALSALTNFERTKNEEKNTLENMIKKHEKMIATFKEQLNNFDKTKEKEQQKLEKRKKELEKFFKDNNIDFKANKRRTI